MIQATIVEVTEQNSQYGTDKKSRVELDDGENKTVYTKPAAKGIYERLAPGLRVELMAKNSGAGYLIKSIIGDAATAAPARKGPPPARAQASPKDIAEYITTSAGQYAYAVKVLMEKFAEVGVNEYTDDLLKAGATSIFIAAKDKFH